MEIAQREEQASMGKAASVASKAKGKREPNEEAITRVVDADLWSSPTYFMLVCGVVVIEWVLRKRYELK